jgi:hypothetical protein
MYARAFWTILVCLAALLLALPAAAVTVGLSEMSSDFGEPNEPTDPNDIPANVTIEVGEFDGTNAGDELRITIDNTLSTYDVSEFWLNYSSDVASVDSLLSFPDLDGGWDLQGSTSVDGFGTFAFGATVDGGVAGVGATVDLVENGSSEVFLLAFTCVGGATCTEDDFNQNNDPQGKAVALKFRNGLNTVDGDSAWGASGSNSPPATPEPGTLLLGGIALLVAARLRRR